MTRGRQLFSCHSLPQKRNFLLGDNILAEYKPETRVERLKQTKECSRKRRPTSLFTAVYYHFSYSISSIILSLLQRGRQIGGCPVRRARRWLVRLVPGGVRRDHVGGGAGEVQPDQGVGLVAKLLLSPFDVAPVIRPF